MSAEFSDDQRAAIDAIAAQTGFSPHAVISMMRALVRGGGRMAQFDDPELGGSGQWMHGGMTMIGAMSDTALKRRVEALCESLLAVIAAAPGARSAQPDASLSAHRSDDGAAWWPQEFGAPNSAGAQNGVHYAYFRSARRLAIDDAKRITIYDSGDHEIGGVAQQQSDSRTLTFTSQLGPVDLATLSIVSFVTK